VDAPRAVNGETALMKASSCGHLEIVRFLVERGGANVNAVAPTSGMTVMLGASLNGHLATVRFLVERGGVGLNSRTVVGRTALILASLNGHLETVRLLLQLGADKLATDLQGHNAIFHASAHPLVLAALS
jgi:ankyrin repeat protein